MAPLTLHRSRVLRMTSCIRYVPSPGAAALRGGLVWAARARSRASSTSWIPPD